MNLRTKKRLAAQVLGVSPKRVMFNPERLDEIKEALTRADIKSLIKDGAIIKKQKRSASGYHAKQVRKQKSKGKRKGHGSRKGTRNARLKRKEAWENKVRLQRKYLKTLREKGLLDSKTFRTIYLKIKSGFFRSKAHLKLYLQDLEVLPKKEQKEQEKKVSKKKEKKTTRTKGENTKQNKK